MTITIYTDADQRVVEGSLPAGQGAGREMTFTFYETGSNHRWGWVGLYSINNGTGDFWDKTTGKPLVDPTALKHVTLDGGTLSFTINADKTDEGNEDFYLVVYESPVGSTFGDEPLYSGVFTVVDDDVRGTDAAETLRGSGYADWIEALSGDDTVLGATGFDTINGGWGNDSLLGETGDDSLIGGLGRDTLTGGIGNDTYVIDATDKLIEFSDEGIDVVVADFSYTLRNHFENLRLSGTDSLTGTGNSFANRIDGNSGNNSLLGMSGNDTIRGGLGSDRIEGGAGLDKLYGGVDAVADRFIFTSYRDSKGSAHDEIYDFVSRVDDLDLRAIDANSKLEGDQKFAFGGKTAVANGVWYAATDDGGIVVRGDVTGNGTADFEIEIHGIKAITGSDIFL